MGGVCLLHERGWHEEVESDKDAHEDLRMLAEAQLVKDKYNTDYYIFNNLLAAVWPFHTMLDAENPNSFYIIRGKETWVVVIAFIVPGTQSGLEARRIDPNNWQTLGWHQTHHQNSK